MSTVPEQTTRVGWCPSVVTPMAASDGLLVRVKPTAATISSVALRALTEAAARCGNGKIDLTNRSNLQIRGLSTDTVESFADTMRTHGLASSDGRLEEVRNVAADPLGADDPAALFDSHALARSLEKMLADTSRLKGLPPKFGFLVDCGHLIPIGDGRADIIVRARGNQLLIGLEGGEHEIPCEPSDVPDIASRLAHAFLDFAGPSDAPPYRMRELVIAVSEGVVLKDANIRISTTATLSASSPGLTRGSQNETADPRVKPGDDDREDGENNIQGGNAAALRQQHLDLMYAPAPPDSPIGYLPFADRDTGVFVVGIPGGRIEARTLTSLADIAETFAGSTIRMTPWRSLVLACVTTNSQSSLMAELNRLNLITGPKDPRRHQRGPDIIPPAADTSSALDAQTL